MKILMYIFVVIGLSGCISTPETGKSAFVLTSEREENGLGEKAYRQILQKEKLSRNVRWNRILQRVGRRIAKAAHRPDFQWEFKLIESKQMNAFCLPGGKVAFYTGILDVAQTEAGIAVVMGHEVAHATARHGGQRISMAMATQLGMAGLSLALGNSSSPKNRTLMAALGLGAQVGVALPFSRNHESEADHIGLVYMARAGYDPREAPRFWSRFSAKTSGGSPPEFLSTHPNSSSRVKALSRQIPSVMSSYQKSPKYGLGERL